MGQGWEGVRPWGLLLFSLQPQSLSSCGLLLSRIIQNFSEFLGMLPSLGLLNPIFSA